MKPNLFSFQIYPIGVDSRDLTWDDCKPVVHEFESYASGIEAAYALSKQLGKITVRVVHLKIWDGTISMIGRMSGAYIQSK